MGLGRVWVAAVGLALGTWSGSSGLPDRRILLLGCLAIGCLGLRRPRRIAGIALLIACGLLGHMNASQRSPGSPLLTELAREVPICSLSGWVKEHSGGLGTVLSIESIHCPSVPLSRDGGIGTATIDGPVGEPGGTFMGEARLVPLGRSSFDGARRRLGAVASLASPDLTFERPRSPLRRAAAEVRRGLMEATQHLEPRRAALLRGLTIGDTSGMDPALTDAFRRAGLSHLVAVSGSNVAIIIGALAWLVRGAGRTLRISLAGVGLLLYVLVVGPEPSVLRAAAMGAIALAALLWGRRSEPLSALGLAVIVVIGIRPGMLFSIGLHLSVAATAGLVLWGAQLGDRFTSLPRPIRLVLGATLAAQLAVAPLLVVTFGQLSIAGPVANVLALGAVPPATVLGMIAGVLGAIGAPPAGLVARLAEPFAWWIVRVGEWTGVHPWSALDLPAFAGWVSAPVVVAAAILSARRGRLASDPPKE
jgi:competence protein ComEC